MIRRVVFIGILCGGLSGSAKAQSSPTYSRAQENDRRPRSGKFTANVDPVYVPQSLAQLVRFAPLIVEATVTANVRAFRSVPNAPLVETHSSVLIDEVVKGELPAGTRSILLAQSGGRVDDVEMVIPGASIVEPGQRYILFLDPDDRKLDADQSGLPRFLPIGVWAGIVKVKLDGVSSVHAPGAASKGLAASIGTLTRDQLRAKIADILANKDILTPENKKLPIGCAT